MMNKQKLSEDPDKEGMNMKKVLSIAGSDCSGGAGIQADLKTIQAHGMYGMSVVTSVTAQNTCKVSRVDSMPAESVRTQLEAIFSDIMPDAVKIGMVYDKGAVLAIAEMIRKYHPANVVMDTPMVSSSGQMLLKADAAQALVDILLPLADLITPNIPEAERITGMRIREWRDMETAAGVLQTRYGCHVLIKGGHLAAEVENDRICRERVPEEAKDHLQHGSDGLAQDYLLDGTGEGYWFYAPVLKSAGTHGTGCTLSSSIACYLAEGCTVKKAVEGAKAYLYQAILHAPGIGKGRGPVGHDWNLRQVSRTSSRVLEQLTGVYQKKELVIFDFDGTLLDSMSMWDHVGTEYILSQGITPPADMEQRLISKTLEESGQYYIEELGLQKTVEEYLQDIYRLVDHKYRFDLVLKPGAKAFVKQMYDAGKKLCILTTTGRPCVEAAAAHYGLDAYIPFDKIFTCGEIGLSKRKPDIYRLVAEKMGCTPEKTICFEDAPFAVKNAKLAGCTICSVYDPSSESGRDIIEEYADFSIYNLWELTR